MDLNKTFKTDAELENNGKWIPFGDECSLLIARMGSTSYNKVFNELSKPMRLQIRSGTLSEPQAEQLLIKTLSRAVLLGWEGVFIDEEELEYSEENAIMILTEYKDFRQQITEIASDIEQFKIAEEEDAAENLETSSDGD